MQYVDVIFWEKRCECDFDAIAILDINTKQLCIVWSSKSKLAKHNQEPDLEISYAYEKKQTNLYIEFAHLIFYLCQSCLYFSRAL